MNKENKAVNWYENYPIITDPKDFFGNVKKGQFVKIATLEIPIEEAKKYSSKKECLKANMNSN